MCAKRENRKERKKEALYRESDGEELTRKQRPAKRGRIKRSVCPCFFIKIGRARILRE